MTTLIMLERGYPIAFVPVTVNPRIGTSGVRLRDGFEALLMLLRAVMIFAPMRVFFPLGAWSVAVGLVYGFVMMSICHAGFPVGAMLIVMAGMFAVMLGLVADQISQMQLSRISERAAGDVERSPDGPLS